MSTAIVQELRENLRLTTEVYGAGSMRTTTAFETLVRVAADAGTPIDGLRHHVADEVERFFSYTIPGLDGHVYWDGGRDFRRNDNKVRAPRRWWWQHKYGNLENSDDLVVKCGERNCINPEHAAKERIRGSARYWIEARLIGAIQVAAFRLGHSPSEAEFQAMRSGPSSTIVRRRFGNWERALLAAGLPPCKPAVNDRSSVLRGIQHARKLLGHWPSEPDYRRLSADLAAVDLPSSTGPAVRLYGSFIAARKAAGGPDHMTTPRLATPGSGGEGHSREECLQSIQIVRERLGRWPSMREFRAESAMLLERGLPASEPPFRRLFGSFTAARVAAGGIPSVRIEEHLRPPHIKRTSGDAVIAGIVFVRERLGRWPSRYEYVAEKAALADAGLPTSEGPAQKVFGTFAAARVAAGGPASLGGRSVRQATGEDASATKGTVT